MAGLYSITGRVTGEVITAAEYNGDHQNHVNNNDAEHAGGFSATESQMQIVTDPGTPGSPSLATSVADELVRLRFVMKALKIWIDPTATHWYSALPPAGSWSSEIATMKRTTLFTDDTKERVDTIPTFMSGGNITITNGPDEDFVDYERRVASSRWRVPEHWVSPTDFTFTWLLTPRTDVGVFRMGVFIARHRFNSDPVLYVATALPNFTSTSLNTIKYDVPIGGTNFAIGDMVDLRLYRLATETDDTLIGTVMLGGLYVTYTANAGQI